MFLKNNLYYNRWRNVQLYTFPEWARSSEAETRRGTELARLDKEIAEAEGQIESARKPTAHKFELKPTGE